MDDQKNIAVFAQSPAKAGFLAEIVRIAGFIPQIKPDAKDATFVCSILADTVTPPFAPRPIIRIQSDSNADLEEGVGAQSHILRSPFRASDLIEKILLLVAQENMIPATLVFHAGVVSTRENLWTPAQGTPVRMTEKETAILAHLYAACGAPVSREDLLANVWSYADTVETHTLETHIYRLRQKIEKNPAEPDILLTVENGYMVRI